MKGIFHYENNLVFWFVFALIIFSCFGWLIDYLIVNEAVAIIVILLLSLMANFGYGLPQPFFFDRTCIIYYLVGATIGKYHFQEFAKKASLRQSLLGMGG